MTDWREYLNIKEDGQVKKKKGPGCKRNKISKNRFGPCLFNDNDECINCHRPRRKITKFDPVTNTIVREYLE